MPSKKRVGSDADSLNSSTLPSAPIKRQRVSLACDPCRTAREKCDGGRPHCGSCNTQNRSCTYTPTSKKRGVQTGYLRAIELSLAWLFEETPECEHALHRLLTQSEGTERARILEGKDASGSRMYRKWNKSRIRKEIVRLISDDKDPRPDTSPSAADSDVDFETSPAGPSSLDRKLSLDIFTIRPSFSNDPTSNPSHSSRSLLILPQNWRQLLDIYFSHTHCWFPILDRNVITTAALSYPPEGFDQKLTNASASHAQLWGALSLASFQDAASPRPSTDPRCPPNRIFTIARRLMPGEDGDFETSHVCALLLHSLVLLGQGKQIAAWLLIGTASRLALNNHSNLVAGGMQVSGFLQDPENRVLAACLVLDTLVSVCLGQSGHILSGIYDRVPTSLELEVEQDAMEMEVSWRSASGLGVSNPPQKDPAGRPLPRPWPTFLQLVKICKILSTSMHAHPENQGPTPEDLAKSLDPQFSFCNSLIYGGSTPLIPSAFILQAIFLMATLNLIPGPRPSLFSNLVEVIESCLENLGASGCPPLLVALVSFVHSRGHMDRMHDLDKDRWKTSIQALRAVWCTNPPHRRSATAQSHRLSQDQLLGRQVVSPPVSIEGFSATFYGKGNEGLLDASNHPSIESQEQVDTRHSQAFALPQRQREQTLEESPIAKAPMPSSMTSEATFPTSFLGGRGNLNNTVPHTPSFLDQMVDYDTILDELGSIDCTDGIDVDPQFMANLGFAPGCDLGEMFQGDYGI